MKNDLGSRPFGLALLPTLHPALIYSPEIIISPEANSWPLVSLPFCILKALRVPLKSCRNLLRKQGSCVVVRHGQVRHMQKKH